MAYSIKPTGTFERQFDRALGYIALELANPQAARSLVAAVERQFKNLAASPFIYPIDEEVTERTGIQIRWARSKGYRILYSIDKVAQTVYPRAFRHTLQSVDSLDIHRFMS